MNRYSAIVDKIAKVTVMDELRYDVAVVQGKIPAYQTPIAVQFFIERALGILRRDKPKIIARIGAEAYNDTVRAFEGYQRVWNEIEKAEYAVQRAKEDLEKMNKANEKLRNVLE